MSLLTPIKLSAWLSHSRDPNTFVSFDPDNRYSLKDLRQQTYHIVEQLQALPGQKVALFFNQSFLFISAFLAVLIAGKTPVLTSHNNPEIVLNQTDHHDLLLHDHPLKPIPGYCLSIMEAPTLSDLPPQWEPSIQDDHPIILYTSGTTGTPTLVLKTPRLLDAEIKLLAPIWRSFTPNTRIVASASHHHQYGLTFKIMMGMALGLETSNVQIESQEQLINVINPEFPHIFITSPAFLKRSDYQLVPPAVFSCLLSAGGLLPWELVETSCKLYQTHLVEIYGSTETGVLAWRNFEASNTPWTKFTDIEFLSNVDGTYSVQSPLLAPNQTITLPDVLTFLSPEQFILHGRVDRIVKIEEKRVSLSEIEKLLSTFDEIQEAHAIVVQHAHNQRVGVVLVLNASSENTPWLQLQTTWKTRLAEKLPPIAIPRYWRKTEQIPYTSQGKPHYSAMEQLFHVPR